MIMLTCLIIFTLINGRFWFVFPTLILMLTSSSCNFKWIIAYLWNSTTCLLKNFQQASCKHWSSTQVKSKFISYCIPFVLSKIDGTELFDFVNGHSLWPNYLEGKEKDSTKGDQTILYASLNGLRTCIRVISSLSCEVMITPDHHSDTNTESLVLGTFMKNNMLAFSPSKVESDFAFSRCADEENLFHNSELFWLLAISFILITWMFDSGVML